MNAPEKLPYLGISYIDMEKVEKLIPLAVNQQDVWHRCDHVIQKIIDSRNKSIDEPLYRFKKYETTQEDLELPTKSAFCRVYYWQQIKTPPPLARGLGLRQNGLDQLSATTSNVVVFLFRAVNQHCEIYALTQKTCRGVVAPFASHSFPHNVAKRLLDRKITYIEYFNLVGDIGLKKQEWKGGKAFSKSNLLTKHVILRKSPLKELSSIHALPAFRTKNGNISSKRTNFTIELDSVTIQKNLIFTHFPAILNHFSKIHRGDSTYAVQINKRDERKPETNAPDFTTKIQLIQDDQIKYVEKALWEELWNCFKEERETTLFFTPDSTKNDYLATDFRIVSSQSDIKELRWNPPQTASEILQMLKTHFPALKECKTSEAFIPLLKKLNLQYKLKKTQKKPFLACFGGEVPIPGWAFPCFKIDGKWYWFSAENKLWIQQEFQKMLKNALLADTEPVLTAVWPRGEKEETYNAKYSGGEGMVVGDKITPNGIELFDLLFRHKDDTIYLYHVKEGFGQNTRDAASQIRNAAKQIHTAISALALNEPNVIEKFALMAPETKFGRIGGKDKFLSLFKNRKSIVFVYAVGDKGKAPRSLKNEMNQKFILTADDCGSIPTFRNMGTIGQDKVFQTLKNLNYLKPSGELTDKFLSETQDNFKDTLHATLSNKGTNIAKATGANLWKCLHEKAGSAFDSMIAKLELIELEKAITNMGFTFKICEIKRN